MNTDPAPFLIDLGDRTLCFRTMEEAIKRASEEAEPSGPVVIYRAITIVEVEPPAPPKVIVRDLL